MACSSSGSMARTRRSRAFSFKIFKLFCLATSNRSAAEPGHSASVRTNSRAWASDRAPACSAALVSGWDSNAAAVSSAVLAEPAVDPVALAIQSDTSAKPRSLCAPQAPARAAARTRAQSQIFSVVANSSTRTAQSSPENSSGSKSTRAARDLAPTRADPCAPHLLDPQTRPSAHTVQGGGPLCPATSRQVSTLSEHTYEIKRKTLILQGFLGCRALANSFSGYRALHGG